VGTKRSVTLDIVLRLKLGLFESYLVLFISRATYDIVLRLQLQLFEPYFALFISGATCDIYCIKVD